MSCIEFMIEQNGDTLNKVNIAASIFIINARKLITKESILYFNYLEENNENLSHLQN
jgi:hypothetical protein